MVCTWFMPMALAPSVWPGSMEMIPPRTLSAIAHGPKYLLGIRNTLILAIAATAIGCLIGFVCGVLNTIPYTKQDPLPKRFVLKLVRVLVNNEHHRGVLDVDDEVVADLGHDVPQGLGKNDAGHGLDMVLR